MLLSEPAVELQGRFVRHVRARGFFDPGDTLVVACSGGLDSCVLVHMLRFSAGLPPLDVRIAHFDHRMRPDSGADASWVRGLAAAWDLPVVIGEAAEPARSESEARSARYRFLSEAREAQGARWVLTAHHADDQAETVLFRILRGTGLAGMRGIPERGAGKVLRPLLPFTRAELEAYAQRWRVPWRSDATNALPRFARNVIRHQILPAAESAVARGARRSLVRLARLARNEEEAWSSLYPTLLDGLARDEGARTCVIARDGLLRYHPSLRARLLREVARRLGSSLDDAGTRTALEFTSSGTSGRRVDLPGGLVLAREYDRLIMSGRERVSVSGGLAVTGPGEGGGTLSLNGRIWQAEWTPSALEPDRWKQAFASDVLSFPLELRAWLPGDRIRMRYGSKKLKKLFAEARIPLGERSRRPVLVDASERVLWVPGLARSADAPESHAGARLTISVTEVQTG